MLRPKAAPENFRGVPSIAGVGSKRQDPREPRGLVPGLAPGLRKLRNPNWRHLSFPKPKGQLGTIYGWVRRAGVGGRGYTRPHAATERRAATAHNKSIVCVSAFSADGQRQLVRLFVFVDKSTTPAVSKETYPLQLMLLPGYGQCRES